jgi:hypothetical protein
MLRLLASASGARYDKPFRAIQIGCAIEMRSIVKALSIRLAPISATGAAPAASMNFHLPRATLALPQRDAGMALMAERAHELAGAARDLALPADDGAPIGDRSPRSACNWRTHSSQRNLLEAHAPCQARFSPASKVSNCSASTGLTKWWSKPAAAVSWRSCSWP